MHHDSKPDRDADQSGGAKGNGQWFSAGKQANAAGEHGDSALLIALLTADAVAVFADYISVMVVHAASPCS
ncbi:MAG: hypothetical protein ABJP02_05065 [Parasphingorhabdus sp.]|uniref:hypothetical protein n=1 Tax=Parasphingorhabdus sp. TaxID=2709688 RepID=UPI003297CF3E